MSDVDDRVTWLRQQLDEDEREVLRHGPAIQGTPWVPASRLTTMQAGATVLMHPRRVLAEVDAKRRILDLCASRADLTFIGSEFPPGDDTELAAAVLSNLALPYADRPGYRDEWRP